MNVLVTVIAGYICSHTCVALLEEGYTVIIGYNLCNRKVGSINKVIEIADR